MQPVPVTRAISGWPLWTRSSRIAVGHEIDEAGHGDDAALLLRQRARGVPRFVADPGGGIDATPRRPRPRPGKAISPALPRMTDGLLSTRPRASSWRNSLAPTPTGSRIQGMPARWADAVERRIASARAFVGVPRFTTSAAARAVISADFLGRMRHDRGCPERQQCVCRRVHHDVVGDAMHERTHAPDAREGGGDIGLLGYDCVHAIPILMADGLEYVKACRRWQPGQVVTYSPRKPPLPPPA